VPLGSPAAISEAGCRVGGQRRLCGKADEVAVLVCQRRRAVAQAMREALAAARAQSGPNDMVLRAAVVESLLRPGALPGAYLRPSASSLPGASLRPSASRRVAATWVALPLWAAPKCVQAASSPRSSSPGSVVIGDLATEPRCTCPALA
jgi:hypothetical protein